MKIPKFLLASLCLVFASAVSAQQAAQSPLRWQPGASAPQAAQPARAPVQNAPAQNRPVAQPPLTPEQQAQVAKQDAEMANAAGWVVQAVDKNNAAEVWRGASSAAKNLVTLDEFVRQVASDRQRLGAVIDRKQAAVTRTVYPAGGQVPPGLYVNVSYMTRFANAPQPVRELVSFYLDDDKVWRVSGYSLR